MNMTKPFISLGTQALLILNKLRNAEQLREKQEIPGGECDPSNQDRDNSAFERDLERVEAPISLEIVHRKKALVGGFTGPRGKYLTTREVDAVSLEFVACVR